MPLGPRRLDCRRDLAFALRSPNSPPSPACGLRPGHRDARARHGPARRGVMRNADRRQHVVARHLGDGLAQRHVDGHQHHPQLVVGEHHAHRHAAAQRLQHFGVAGVRRRRPRAAPPCGSARSRWPRAAPACARRTACSMQRAAAAPARTSTWPNGASTRSAGIPGAASTGTQRGGTPAASRRRIDRRHRHAADEPRRATHHRQVADDGAAGRCVARERHRDDLRPDPAGIAHRDQRHAGFSISMNSCSSPNASARCAATAGAP